MSRYRKGDDFLEDGADHTTYGIDVEQEKPL